MDAPDYYPPADALKFCPAARAAGWSVGDLGQLLRMRLIRGWRTKHRSAVCLPDVAQLAQQARPK